MGVSDKLWDALSTVIKMNDKIVGMSAQMQAQQQKIEDLTRRVIAHRIQGSGLAGPAQRVRIAETIFLKGGCQP